MESTDQVRQQRLCGPGGSSGGTAAKRTTSTAFLLAKVHLDAAKADPAAYLQALWWRMRGLKVRARNRLSVLAAHSPFAYDLWIARKEVAAAVADHDIPPANFPILPVVDCRGSSHLVEETLESIARAGTCLKPVVLGGAAAGAHTIRSPRELAAFLPGDEGWICALRAGDLLAPHAFAIYAFAPRGEQTRVLFADDDLLDDDSRRRHPHFKPEWNPELFAHHDYLTGSCLVRATLDDIQSLEGGDWPRQLLAKALGSGEPPVRVPRFLHHRRSRPQPYLPAAAPAPPHPQPTVSVIIPTRNARDLLEVCIAGLERTSYQPLDVTIVDNGSDDPDAIDYLRTLEETGYRVLRRPGPFNFSRLNNDAARQATGQFLCFLNNDVEMTEGSWLGSLVAKAMQPDLGAVGARLLYPDGSVQHAGICLGMGGAAGHAHRHLPAGDPGFFQRARLPQRVSAVTAACLVVEKEKFLAVGGFDEASFPVAFNDVDLCLKLNERGWQSFYEPRATLIHYESRSRGKDDDRRNRARFQAELGALRQRWRTDQRVDPFHHPELSRTCEQFVIAL